MTTVDDLKARLKADQDELAAAETKQMRFQLSRDWPVGARVIPVGTFLEIRDGKLYAAGSPDELPLPLPLEAIPQDQTAYDEILRQHPYQAHRILTYDPNIDRHGDSDEHRDRYSDANNPDLHVYQGPKGPVPGIQN